MFPYHLILYCVKLEIGTFLAYIPHKIEFLKMEVIVVTRDSRDMCNFKPDQQNYTYFSQCPLCQSSVRPRDV